MGNTKDLQQQEAIDKMKQLAEDAKLCVLVTGFDKYPPASRPMATQEVDEDGTFWFFSSAKSDKNRDIHRDNRVHLIYSNRGDSEFLSVYGKAEIVHDRDKAKKLWNVFLTTWFNQGVDDPDLTLIKVTPDQGHYWDTKHNKMVQSLKIVIGAIRGKMMDDGIEGEINP